MTKTVKWSRYLWLSLLCFSFFLLELVSIFGIEMLFLRVDVWAYTPDQRARHSLITAALWAAAMAALLLYARRRYGFPTRAGIRQKSSAPRLGRRAALPGGLQGDDFHRLADAENHR